MAEKIYTLLIPFCFWSAVTQTLMAQEVNSDSLRLKLKTLKEDTEKVLLLIKIGQQYEFNDPDSALQFYKEAGALSEKINYPYGEIKYLNNYTNILNQQGNFDQSLELSTKAMELGQKNKLWRSYYGSIFNIGNIYTYKGDNETALKYYFQALPYFEKTQDSSVLSLIFSCICTGYRGLGLLSKSEEFGRKALNFAKSRSDRTAALNNLGEVIVLQKHYAEAFSYFNETYETAKRYHDDRAEGAALINIGDIYNHQRQNKPALDAYYRAAELCRKIQNLHGLAESYKGLGYTYILQNEMEKAEKNYMMALDTAVKYEFLEMQMDIYGEMAFVEGALGKTELAIRYDSLERVINDSLFNKMIAKNTQELQVKYESQKKQSEIVKLQIDKQIQAFSIRQKSILIGILIGSIAVLLLLGFLVFRIYHQKQQLQSQKIIDLEKDKQLMTADAMLKGQEEERSRLAKDLHDGLGGILTGAKLSFINMKDNLIMTEENSSVFEKSLDMIDISIRELRRVAQNLMPEALLKLGLDKAIKDYCNAIQRSSQINLIYQSFGMESRFAENTEIIIYRIIQELLNNVMKHAGAKRIFLQIVRENERLHITLEDDGKGFDVNGLAENKGSGWNNIRSRVDYLKGNLDLKSESNKGTWVNLEFVIS
jgi:two-component system, NarL family, sensor kinase